jgi:hypothetical protein
MTTHERMFEKGFKWWLSKQVSLNDYELMKHLEYWVCQRGKKKDNRATKAFVSGALAARSLGK